MCIPIVTQALKTNFENSEIFSHFLKFHRGEIFLKKCLVFWTLNARVSRTVNVRELNEAILNTCYSAAFIWWYCEVLNMSLKKWLDIPTWAQKTYPSASPEPWLQFSQTRPHFLQNHEENPVKIWNLKKFIDLGAWGLGTSFGWLGPRRRIHNHKSRTLAPIFTNKTSFFQESWDESNKIIKSQKIFWPMGLGSKN